MAPNTEEGVQQVTLGRLVLRLRACAPKPRSRAKLYRTHQVPTRCERAGSHRHRRHRRCCCCRRRRVHALLPLHRCDVRGRSCLGPWEVASDIGERFAVAWWCWLLVATRHMAAGHARCPGTALWAVLIRAYRPSSHRRCRLPAVAP